MDEQSLSPRMPKIWAMDLMALLIDLKMIDWLIDWLRWLIDQGIDWFSECGVRALIDYVDGFWLIRLMDSDWFCWWILMDFDGLWWIVMDYDGLWSIMMDSVMDFDWFVDGFAIH